MKSRPSQITAAACLAGISVLAATPAMAAGTAVNPNPRAPATAPIAVTRTPHVLPLHGTRVLSGASLARLDGSPGGVRQLTLRPGTTPPFPGQVLAAGVSAVTPYGLLGRVQSVRTRATGTVVQLTPATMQDAVPEGQFAVHGRLSSQDVLKEGIVRGVAPRTVRATDLARRSLSLSATPINLQVNNVLHCTGNVNVNVTGSVSVRPDFHLSGGLTWGLPPTLSATFAASIAEDAVLRASATGAASCAARVPLFAQPITFAPITFFIGPVPFVLVPQLQVYLDAQGRVSVTVTAQAHQSATLSAQVTTGTGGIDASGSLTGGLTGSVNQVTGNAGLEAGVSPQFDLLLDGVAGLRVVARGYLGVTADSAATPWWTLYGGVTAGLDFVVPLLNINWGKENIISKRWILAQALGITTGPLPSAVSGHDYSTALAAVGGSGSYVWSLASGTLPPGLTLSPQGLIGGIPSAVPADTLSTFNVLVRDSAGRTSAKTLTLAIQGAPPLNVATRGLPTVEVLDDYATQLVATGGTEPYTWRLTSGQMPAGLSLNQSGSIEGTAVRIGTKFFTVTVTDAVGRSASATLRITVTRAPIVHCPKLCP